MADARRRTDERAISFPIPLLYATGTAELNTRATFSFPIYAFARRPRAHTQPRTHKNNKKTGSKPLWRLSAHDKPACALSFCPSASGLLATASTDKTVKLWDVSGDSPLPLATERPNLGAVFAAAFCGADAPHLLAMGGAKGSVGVWDVRSVKAVAKRWPGLMDGATFPDKPATAKGGKRQDGRRGGKGGDGDDDDDGRDHEEGLSSTDEEEEQ